MEPGAEGRPPARAGDAAALPGSAHELDRLRGPACLLPGWRALHVPSARPGWHLHPARARLERRGRLRGTARSRLRGLLRDRRLLVRASGLAAARPPRPLLAGPTGGAAPG